MLGNSTVYGHVLHVVVHIYIVDVLCQVWCARWIQLDIAIGHVLELLELLQLFLSRLWEHIEDGLYLLGFLAVLISPHVLLRHIWHGSTNGKRSWTCLLARVVVYLEFVHEFATTACCRVMTRRGLRVGYPTVLAMDIEI